MSNNMKIAVLTTETQHHTFFVRELAKEFSSIVVVEETRFLKAPFSTAHPFEKEREDYEREVFFKGQNTRLRDVADVFSVESVNDKKSEDFLREQKPDVVLVFGTGRIYPEIINICPHGFINLHGGDPEVKFP